LKFLKNLIIKATKWDKLINIGVVYVDSSEYDCGICFQSGIGWNFQFSKIGISFHINNKELVAAIIGLELCRQSGMERAIVFSDNTSVVGWLKKWSDVKSVWRSFIMECWSFWWRLNGFSFDVAWISSNLNPADKWTRW